MAHSRSSCVRNHAFCLVLRVSLYLLGRSRSFGLTLSSTIIGSSLGGSLADPVHNYPRFFSPDSIFGRYPYLLPNLVSTSVVLFGLTVGILFLEETHEKKKSRRDPGVELGRWILRRVHARIDDFKYSKLAEANLTDTEATALIPAVQEPPNFALHNTAKRSKIDVTTIKENPITDHDDEAVASVSKPTAKRAFTRQVVLSIVSYGILALYVRPAILTDIPRANSRSHTISFEQLLPVLLSMKPTESEIALPFKFLGGFGFTTSTIGFILSMQGFYQMFAQMVLFPIVVRRLGPLKTIRFAAMTYPMLYMIVPYLVLLPPSLRMFGLGFVLFWKITHQALAYPSHMLLLTNSAPSLLVLGLINGIAASAASLARAIGPTVSGIVQSAGLDAGYVGMPWWVTSLVAIIGALECWLLREPHRA